jgi:hypothetical protein
MLERLGHSVEHQQIVDLFLSIAGVAAGQLQRVAVAPVVCRAGQGTPSLASLSPYPWTPTAREVLRCT